MSTNLVLATVLTLSDPQVMNSDSIFFKLGNSIESIRNRFLLKIRFFQESTLTGQLQSCKGEEGVQIDVSTSRFSSPDTDALAVVKE